MPLEAPHFFLNDNKKNTIDYIFIFIYFVFLIFIYFIFIYLQFAELLERDGAAMASLEYRTATVFAPTNQAFQRYPELKANVLYHISKNDSFICRFIKHLS